MLQTWIAECELTALDGVKPFWEGPHRRVIARLVLRATSPKTFAHALQVSIAAGNAELSKIRSIQPLSEASTTQNVIAAAERADSNRPILVETPVPQETEIPVHFDDANWEDLEHEQNLWIVLDGVSWTSLPEALAGSDLEYACLYTAADQSKLAAAPWLVRMDQNDPLCRRFRSCSHADHCGILLKSTLGLTDLRQHLRRFTMLPTPIGSAVPQYFRFYDPRVFLDATAALPRQVFNQFVKPIEYAIVPLTPQCALPYKSRASETPTIFSPPDTCRNRLVRVTWDNPPIENVKTPLRIDEDSFAAFGKLQNDRAVAKLALHLHESQMGAFSQQECLRVARSAPDIAARFEMRSKKQITVVAHAMLRLGDEFWLHNSEAHAALTAPGQLPWQRKNNLQNVLVKIEQKQLLLEVVGDDI